MPARKKTEPDIRPDLTRTQAARLLNVGLPTIDRMLADGTLPSYKIGGSQRAGRRIPQAGIDKLRAGRDAETLKTDDPVKWAGGAA